MSASLRLSSVRSFLGLSGSSSSSVKPGSSNNVFRSPVTTLCSHARVCRAHESANRLDKRSGLRKSQEPQSADRKPLLSGTRASSSVMRYSSLHSRSSICFLVMYVRTAISKISAMMIMINKIAPKPLCQPPVPSLDIASEVMTSAFVHWKDAENPESTPPKMVRCGVAHTKVVPDSSRKSSSPTIHAEATSSQYAQVEEGSRVASIVI
mmetsp:Transcript_31886/g.72772  ORF Transcript_31886/g.72772 Transcript_31886/m.72772 type:complete len:209 (+) Transcript_31886:998-1624(+)